MQDAICGTQDQSNWISTSWQSDISKSRTLNAKWLWYKKSKGFPYSLLSVGFGADTSVQAVSPHKSSTRRSVGCHYFPPGLWLPSQPQSITKLYCLVTEAHRCEQLAQGCDAAFALSRIWIHDLLIASPSLYPLQHSATHYDFGEFFISHSDIKDFPN